MALFSIITSCSKSNTSDLGCGCNTDSIAHRVTYNNFGGYAYVASIKYDTFQKLNDWFISVGIPNTNYGALLKVCNPNLPSIRAITDNMPNKYVPTSILFYGKLTWLCSGEGFGFQFPETITEHVIVDSIKRN